MEAKSKEFEKISRISHGKIPVSEDSPVFNLFAQRREIARKIQEDDFNEDSRQYAFEVFYSIEDRIKEYLYL